MKWSMMFALTLLLVVGVSLGSAQAEDKGGEKTIVGYVSDSMCGLDHASMKMGDDKTCTLKCESGAKFVLADRDHKVVYALDDAAQEKARAFAGQKVAVTGQVDAKAKTINLTNRSNKIVPRFEVRREVEHAVSLLFSKVSNSGQKFISG